MRRERGGAGVTLTECLCWSGSYVAPEILRREAYGKVGPLPLSCLCLS